MSRCPPNCCPGCRDEAHQERISQKTAKKQLDICSVSPLPEMDHHPNPNADYLDPDNIDSDLDTPLLEEGDHILGTGLLPPLSIDIRASSTILQRLAEAHKANSEAINPVPNYLQEFTSVFSKKSFDVLPEPREWDHTVELIPSSKSSNCKVYPLSLVEQKELNVFLKENLETGHIQPSKSLMSSPVFFIKKKDGSLQLVQDYRALNAITIKNKYLLLLISELINKLQGARYFTKLNVCWGFRVYQLLQKVHRRFLSYCQTSIQPDQE